VHNAGGKSDPYFEIRSAFGRGYVSPSAKQGKEPYQGKHDDKPLYKSEHVSNDLNPIWKARALDLNRICNGAVDLKAGVLIDLWDHDVLNAREFMGYVEVSLEDLIDCAESGSPLQVQGPKGKEDAGRLHVEKAVVGFPQVKRTSRTYRTSSPHSKICQQRF